MRNVEADLSMLREVTAEGRASGTRRRWFDDDYFDLIVWYSPDGAIGGFQLCYDKQGHERALTWVRSRGFSHNRIDDGEEGEMVHKMSPILVADGSFDADAVLRRFRDASRGIDPVVALAISEIIERYPRG